MQPDEGQDETPTLEKPSSLSQEVDAAEVDIGKSSIESETIDGSASNIEQSDVAGGELKVTDHTSPKVIDHTSPMSLCSTKSTDDTGDQKLSTPGADDTCDQKLSTPGTDDTGEQKLLTPGAASSGYGSAVLTQTTSSDDLLGDHAANGDINGDLRSAVHPNSMLVTAEVNIIDAAVPTDLGSPLKPTTPYDDEPATVLATSNHTSVVDSTASNDDVVANSETEVSESSQEHSSVVCGAILNTWTNGKMDSESNNVTAPSEDQDLEKKCSVTVVGNDNSRNNDSEMKESLNNGSCTPESVTDSSPSIYLHTSCLGNIDEDDSVITAEKTCLTDLQPKPQTSDNSSITARSVKTSYRPVSMPPEMTVIEDEKMEDISALGNCTLSLSLSLSLF